MNQKLVAVVALSVFLFGCSKVAFQEQAKSSNDVLGDPNGKQVESFQAATRTVETKNDLLFVVDESVSMRVILTAMREGFAAISTAKFPEDTKIAVTNTAPAYYSDLSMGFFDPTQGFVNVMGLTSQPGFLKLVSESSIQNFLATNPASAANFSNAGCAQEWFSPGDLNAAGLSCLSAATQVAYLGTGVEAGAVSLDQLVSSYFNSSRRLFREGALVNVVFVSDTHDPGAAYYGKPGAPTAFPSFASINNKILAANPGIRAVKFNGIVPLPPQGDVALNGIRTVGVVPATIADSQVSGEKLWDFDYLKLIGPSGGVAMHPVGNNWADTLSQMLEEFKVLRAPAVLVSRRIDKIERVLANGVELAPGDYTIQPDLQHIQLRPNDLWPDQIDIVVEYLPVR